MPRNPLDVLAQQIVAMTAMDDWEVTALEQTVRRAAPFASLTRGVLEAVLDMLAGRYPSEDFAALRPRLVWDRTTGMLHGRPGGQRLAVTSGGTIPDRGLFGVFLAGGQRDSSGRHSRRVGELDEEMVYESRVGDVFVLGASSWRIEDITADQVLVSPAPGQPGRLPFWHGDAPGRQAELGRAIGQYCRELAAASPQEATDRLRRDGLDELAAANLVSYLAAQREATGYLPDDKTLVMERFRDELGDWRLVLHSPYGARLHAPWALAIAARLRDRYPGMDVQALHTDDGIVIRVPDADDPPPAGIAELDPDEVEQLVTAELGASALFASRFRECAARALLLPRRQPGRRTPLWQQRQRSAQLLSVASQYATFPIVLETVRECLQDVFDVPGLVGLLRDLAARRVRLVEVETSAPSPFGRSLLFRYVGAFMYEGDAPLAERRAQALALDSSLLAELLGQADARELLDPDIVQDSERDAQCLPPRRACRDRESVADMLRAIGPLSAMEVEERCTDPGAAPGWLAELAAQRRLIEVRVAGEQRWAAIEDAGRLRDALGVALPVGVPTAFTEPVGDPLGDLVARYARTHGPFTAGAAAQRYGLGVAVVAGALRRLAAEGRVAEGEFLPGGRGTEWCDTGMLRLLRRRCLAKLRREAEPVPPRALARFLPAWQDAVRPAGRNGSRAARGRPDAVYDAIEQLAGAAIAASALETLVLPGRVPGYSPALLDELTAAGDVVWSGAGGLPGGDGWLVLAPADAAPLLFPEPAEITMTPLHDAVLAALDGGGALFFRALADRVGAQLRPTAARPWGGWRRRRHRPGAGRGHLGPGLGGPADQRHARPAARRAGLRPAGGRRRPCGGRRARAGDRGPADPGLPGKPGPPRAARDGIRPGGAAVPERPADGQREMVAAAAGRAGRGGPDQAAARAGRDPAGPARRADQGCGRGRAGDRRIRRAVPGAAGDGGSRPVPARLLRRGPRRGAVRAARGGGPDARDGRPRCRAPSGHRAGRGRSRERLRGGAALAAPAGRDPGRASARPQGGRARGPGRRRARALRRARRQDPAVLDQRPGCARPGRRGARRRRPRRRARTPHRGARRRRGRLRLPAGPGTGGGRVPADPARPAPARLGSHSDRGRGARADRHDLPLEHQPGRMYSQGGISLLGGRWRPAGLAMRRRRPAHGGSPGRPRTSTSRP